jgi:hypothetical protein
LNQKKTYRLVIGLFLLLFTQVVLPNMHHHAEEYKHQGINISGGDECFVCAHNLVSPDFVLPALFFFSVLSIAYSEFRFIFENKTFHVSIFSKGRAPPIVFA